jgi:hypothetical protein
MTCAISPLQPEVVLALKRLASSQGASLAMAPWRVSSRLWRRLQRGASSTPGFFG